jgi:hypothetical protein
VKIETASHLHGEVIAEHAFPVEHDSLLDCLGRTPIPLRPLSGFRASGRPLEPKRHMRSIHGQRRASLLPVDQAGLNDEIDRQLRLDGWERQPVASGPLAGPNTPLNLKGDFVKNRVFIEVEFGNVASMHRDFFKFQIANRSGSGDVGVLVVATDRLARFFDSGVATFEAAMRNRPYLAIGVQMPVWFVGIEPSDFSEISARYEEMRRLCEENGVECHTFEAAFGEPPRLPVDESDGSAYGWTSDDG